MISFSRPSRTLLFAALAGGLLLTPPLFAAYGPFGPPGPPLLAAAGQRVAVLTDDPAMVNHPAAGYLGVGTRDVDTERASQLRLKAPRGAEIVFVDHDAPAARAGLQLHDVILAMDSQPVEGQAQLSRMLRHTAPGRTVTFLISRGGQQQSITVQLVDRSTVVAPLQTVPPPNGEPSSLPASTLYGSGFLSPFAANRAYTGLELDMLGPQLADYFGVSGGQGLLVKWVDENSPAATAGLRAGDVITMVNGKTVSTVSQWLRTMRGNQGKQVLLTVIRDHRENTVTMMAGRPKGKGHLQWPGIDGETQPLRLSLNFAPQSPASAISHLTAR